VAFLRGINVGGHKVSMSALKSEFEELGFEDVATFINSGNVLFSASGKADALELRIEERLEPSLGYEVPTFVRTAAEVARIAKYEPFKGKGEEAYQVGFLKKALSPAARKAFLALATEKNPLRARGRETYWLTPGGMMQSEVEGKDIDKAIGQVTTLRHINTVRRLADKLAADAD
jgi:uncharacterized protein (DUF1697 family)